MSKYSPLWEYIKDCGKEKLQLTFNEIESIVGIPIDHSFLTFKKELVEYGYTVGKISIKLQTVTFERIKTLVIYVHGKGGDTAEARHYKKLFPKCDIIGLEYKARSAMEAMEEFPQIFKDISPKRKPVILIANSIGAYYSMLALPQKNIEKAYFISPIVDMERLIMNMMQRANVSEKELEEKRIIKTDFDEVLSWDYLSFVRSHPICWNIPTEILYGEKDNLTPIQTINDFTQTHKAKLTIMENGEHWFHTEEQMAFLDKWIEECENNEKVKV